MTARATSSPAASTVASEVSPGPTLLVRVTATADDVAPLVARLTLGLVMLPHGAQKVLGWFGGHGLAGTMSFFTETLGIPAPFAALAIATEFLGALGLVVGALSRIAALGIAATMLVAIAMVHARFGFFMNWFGAQAGEGFEYHVLAIGLALVVLIKGGGARSFDRWFTTRRP